MADPLLCARALTVSLGLPEETAPLVDDVSMEVHPGATLALIGESGAGKSLIARALTGLLPDGLRLSAGTVTLCGQVLTDLDETALADLRRTHLSFIPQESVLHPTLTVGRQLADVMRTAGTTGRRTRSTATALLEQLGVPPSVIHLYPHQLSAGTERIVSATLALSRHPKLVVADEPTLALDPFARAVLFDAFRRFQDEQSMGLLIVTEDIGLALEFADTVVIVSHGRVIERGNPRDVFDSPQHAQTRRLLTVAPASERAT